MTEEKLKQILDKLVKDVQAMEQSRPVGRTLQALEHAVFCITPEDNTPEDNTPEDNTGLVA